MNSNRKLSLRSVKKNNCFKNDACLVDDILAPRKIEQLLFKQISLAALINKICIRLETLLSGQHLTINCTGLDTDAYIYFPWTGMD